MAKIRIPNKDGTSQYMTVSDRVQAYFTCRTLVTANLRLQKKIAPLELEIGKLKSLDDENKALLLRVEKAEAKVVSFRKKFVEIHDKYLGLKTKIYRESELKAAKQEISRLKQELTKQRFLYNG